MVALIPRDAALREWSLSRVRRVPARAPEILVEQSVLATKEEAYAFAVALMQRADEVFS